jgi:hypothetical protein
MEGVVGEYNSRQNGETGHAVVPTIHALFCNIRTVLLFWE